MGVEQLTNKFLYYFRCLTMIFGYFVQIEIAPLMFKEDFELIKHAFILRENAKRLSVSFHYKEEKISLKRRVVQRHSYILPEGGGN